jgi:hypothetical protein
VRRPRLDYESHATALDRNELGALLVAAGLGPPAEHALISLLALNGLRVSEAAGADIEHMGTERGHRTLAITRKGGKVVTIPLAPRTARAIDLATGERTEGPMFLGGDGKRLDRHGAARIVRRVTRRAGIGKKVSPHTLRHAFITAALDAGVPLRDVQEAKSPAMVTWTPPLRRGQDKDSRPCAAGRESVLLTGRLADSGDAYSITLVTLRSTPAVGGCGGSNRLVGVPRGVTGGVKHYGPSFDDWL